MTLFKYEPIDLDRSTFRLVRLLRGNNVDIECELFQALLHQSDGLMSYEALSYTWGSIEKPDNIIINGSKMSVTLNLYIALKYLRFEDEDRILWIDAICIDQDNIKERGHQVRQMTHIYNKAERAIIWLGPATYETNVIMHSMKQLQEESINYASNDWKISDERWVKIWSAVQPILRSNHGNLIALQREGLKSLLERSWFKRVWILQEVVSARAAVVMCGAKFISTRIFTLIPSLVGINPDCHCQAVLDVMPGPSRKESWWSEKQDLHTLLVKFSKSEATDPRDIIYALLGISSDVCNTDFLYADYTKSVEEVIHKTTAFLLSSYELGHTIYSLPGWTLPQFLENLNSLSNTLLNWAFGMEHEAMVKLLLKCNDIDLNSMDKNGRTLLVWAAQNGHELVVELLLEKGAELETKFISGRTPLSWAAQNGHESVVELLLEKGAELENKDTECGRTPLSWAAQNGHGSVVELLLEKGAELENKDTKYGRTPLSWAAEKGQKAVVELLLEKGAELETKSISGRTPLSWAAQKGHKSVVKLLKKGRKT